MRFVDLFAGIGGFHLALHAVGGTCVFASEIDPAARYSYERNFASHSPALFQQGCFAGDLQKVEPATLPQFDVLCAGFPCQPFSICGKQKGFNDTRGTLFFNVCQIIQAKQPQVVFLENVKHLLHHDQGKTLAVILESLEDLGYFVRFKVLNAVDFGVPQNRERIIIIATKNKPFEFNRLPQPTPKQPMATVLEEAGEFDTLDPSEYTLLAQMTRQPHSGLLFAGYRNKNIRVNGTRPNTKHLSRVHKQPNRIYSIEGTHPTLPSQESAGRFFIYNPKQASVRRLTLRECYRLMGYPDTFLIHPSKGEAYKQVGNSVCIPMIQALAKVIDEQFFNVKEPSIHNVRPFSTVAPRIRQQSLFATQPALTHLG
jgi:DNA (cytosine-5)-methyltransferase 1